MISYNHYIEQQFSLPLTYDLIAVFLFAITGSLIAVRRGYDPIGVAIITIISGAGGSILRDAVFLNIQPAAITNWYYSAVILSAFFVVLLARSFFKTRPIAYLIIMVEALGIGLNSVYGTQKSLATGLSIFSAIIIGINNAIGGRLMRDVIMGLKRKNLVAVAEKHFNDKGVNNIMIQCSSFNKTALAVYKSLGYMSRQELLYKKLDSVEKQSNY